MRRFRNSLLQKSFSLFTLYNLAIGLIAFAPLHANEIIPAHHDLLSIAPRGPESGTLKKPLLFEENKGQTGKEAEFILRGKGYTLFLTANGAAYSLQVPAKDAAANEQRQIGTTETLQMKFSGANENPAIKGLDEAITKTNYYIGKEKFVGLSNFGKVNYSNLYNGIDAVFYGNYENQLEYDFIVSPNADANQIKLEFDGAKDLSINSKGDLILKTENAEMAQQKPVAYQIIEGERKEVAASYKLSGNLVSFEIGEYDKSQVLIIDPILNYLSYIGGNDFDEGHSVKVDQSGNFFVAGTLDSLDYPVPNSRQSGNGSTIYITKISADGSTILYNTFLDGRTSDGTVHRYIWGLNSGTSIAIDGLGNAYIAGDTASGNFPVSDNAYQRISGCARYMLGFCAEPFDAFVTKLNPQGAMVYSTILGGRYDDWASGIVIDSAGKAYITGGTRSGFTFPTKNEYQGTGVFGIASNAFLAVLNTDGSDITYATALGGNNSDEANAIAIDSSNNVYITGETESDSSFPTKNAFQTSNNGGKDAFVAKFNPALSGESSLIYSTYLRGAGTDIGKGIAVNSSNQAVVVGVTGSADFPLANPIRSSNQINEAFVSVIGAGGNTLVNSTFLGGADRESANGVALDTFGNIYVTGSTRSNNFPLALPFQAVLAGESDAFITKLKFGKGILSSSYLGGNGNDAGFGIAVKENKAFVVGDAGSNNLATTNGAIKPDFGDGSRDGFMAKIIDSRLDSVGVFRPGSTFIITQSTATIVPLTLPFTGGLSGRLSTATGVSGDWDGDGVDTIGSFTNGGWKIRNINFPVSITQASPLSVNFGQTGDLPVVGDWNGDGIDTVGVYRPSTRQFFLSNSNVNPPVDVTINFGATEDLPIAGDWNGDGIDTIALFRPSLNQTFFVNQNVVNPSIDFTSFLGTAEDLPTAGDWDGNGIDTLGLYRPSIASFILSDDNVNIDNLFIFGQTGDKPIAGDWDGLPIP